MRYQREACSRHCGSKTRPRVDVNSVLAWKNQTWRVLYVFAFLSDCASFTASATPFSAAVRFTFARSAPLSDFRVKGDMPYPSPGTACSLFGFQTAAHDALARRRH